MKRVSTILLLVFCLVGCSQDANTTFDRIGNSINSANVNQSMASNPSAVYQDADKSYLTATGLVDETTRSAPSIQRKIIYTANIVMVVEDLSKTEKQIKALVDQHKGYISQSRRDNTYGDQLTGRWVVRMPATEFENFLEGVEPLGVPENRQTDANDVTEKYVDLEARLKNQRRLEERMLKLVDERTGKISDVVAVETKLGSIREEIERLEGSIRYLSDQTAMSTVSITAREEKDYTPPQAPTFAAKIQSAFGGSMSGMLRFGQAAVLVFVTVGPWLLVFAVFAVPFILFGKRLRSMLVEPRQG